MILTCPETGYKHVNEARNILILNQENEILSQQQSVERYASMQSASQLSDGHGHKGVFIIYGLEGVFIS
jgi:predicted esterase YcpF (UPF0227 family)